jgi:hypothetical protein
MLVSMKAAVKLMIRNLLQLQVPVRLTRVTAVMVLWVLTSSLSAGQSTENFRLGIPSDWSHRHVLFPVSRDISRMHQPMMDPRWLHNWYLRHPEFWWRQHPRRHSGSGDESRRDWSYPLGTATYDPLIDFSFSIGAETGYGSVNTTDEGNAEFLATVGTMTITAGSDVGTYPLYPGGPGVTLSPLGAFDYNDLIYLNTNPPLDVDGLLFVATGLEINVWGNSPNNYSFYDYSNGSYGTQITTNGTFTTNVDPEGGQTFPAKYVFDVNAAPSCTNDFVAIGIAAEPASGGQANIVGMNNLYSTQGASTPAPLCGTTGPTVLFAYASGTGEVPASIVLSQNGTQLAYVENLSTGSSYFHVLTIGTTGTNGTSPTAAVVPGSAGGNNAVDQRVLLSPNGGITTQSSTTAPYVVYTPDDANDYVYVTTYSWTGGGVGYLYKVGNVFSPSGSPTIVWSIPITAVPSAPVYDSVSNKIFFTDSSGRIDYVIDSGATPSVVYGSILAPGTTSENPVVIDSTNEMVYACFNSNGTNAIVVQAPTSMASTVTVAVGSSTATYTGPYGVEFNNAWYTGSGTPLMYVAGTGSGTLPTLYGVGFNASGVLNPSSVTSTALATGAADSSPLTEFYNSTLLKDYLFAGVTNNCIATTEGGTAGCVMRLDITSGFPTVNVSTTALAAAGGTTGIIVDNDSSLTQASSIYYATKTGVNLVKATQAGLN